MVCRVISCLAALLAHCLCIDFCWQLDRVCTWGRVAVPVKEEGLRAMIERLLTQGYRVMSQESLIDADYYFLAQAEVVLQERQRDAIIIDK
jgi:hypothetical protein